MGQLDAREALENISNNLDKIATMEEQALGVYISMVTRGVNLRISQVFNYKEDLETLSQKIKDRMEVEIETGNVMNILHDVGNYMSSLEKAKMFATSRCLKPIYNRSLMEAFGSNATEEMASKFSDLPF